VRARLTRRSDPQHTGDDTTDDTTAADVAAAQDPGPPNERRSKKPRRPLYHRLLRLRHISPSGWQRAAFADGPLVVAIVLVLADLASAWTLLVLPLAVAVVVKSHDVLAGLLARPPASRGPGPG
jgi:hypothetical protein